MIWEENEADVERGIVNGDWWFSVGGDGWIVRGAFAPPSIGEPRYKASRTKEEAKAECRYMLGRWLSGALGEYNMVETTAAADEGLVDLGWENGWRLRPEIAERCLAARRAGGIHDTTSTSTNRGLHKFTCRTCGFFYQTDSGD